MRKTLLFILGAALALPAAAQSWDQAQLFSEEIYNGTARSMAMGNALTAVGGDLGSVNINPAGSSVAGYSQVVVTPGLSISVANAQGYSDEGLEPLGLGNKVNSSFVRMKLPNIGFILNMETGRRHGLKRLSFGFLANSTNDFTGRMNSSGVLYGKNSFAGSLASLADGYSPTILGGDWYLPGPEWSAMAGYRSGIFDQYGQDRYLAVTDIMVNGKTEAVKPLFQRYGEQTKGFKHDIILNLSANWENKFYLGANLGVTVMNYVQSEYWEEQPADPSNFPPIEYDDGAKIGTFNSLLAKRMYQVTGSGIYFKAGFLWRPFAGFRIGAAVQTPTLMNMTGRLAWQAESNISGMNFSPAMSPEDKWTYAMTMPFRFNVGLAYSFGSFAVLSVDYEMADYSHNTYRSRSEFRDEDTWVDVNADITDVLGVSHYLRAGLEFKPIPALSIRAGYNLLTTPQKNWLNYDYTVTPLTHEEKQRQNRHIASFGAGYSIGPFFADIAVRLRFLPTTYYVPYYKYTYAANYQNKFIDELAEVPMVMVSAKGIDTTLTLGWRF